ncbi:unnamed protein product [marine sediment metagenome]|uniref:Uncharacterized protein n=1 Tax=marine sediment metagenome TaxID=412755 RepID=X0SY06_9ZZZZ
MLRSLLVISISLLAFPVAADIEDHCWFQGDATDEFVTVINDIRGTIPSEPVTTDASASQYCGVGNPDCWQHCAQEEALRPYFWTVIAINDDGETEAENGPQQRDTIYILVPPVAPILIGPILPSG